MIVSQCREREIEDNHTMLSLMIRRHILLGSISMGSCFRHSSMIQSMQSFCGSCDSPPRSRFSITGTAHFSHMAEYFAFGLTIKGARTGFNHHGTIVSSWAALKKLSAYPMEASRNSGFLHNSAPPVRSNRCQSLGGVGLAVLFETHRIPC